MEFTALELILLPIGLGLLGFVEPCTIGGHLLFLETQADRPRREKVSAVSTFVAVRSLVSGLFGALAATTGTVMTGFVMMFLFGLFLSSPLALFAADPSLASWLETLGQKMKRMRWLIGVVFALLGLWSIWFGLYVDPADWSGQ